jgi:dienelactone hydrolase
MSLRIAILAGIIASLPCLSARAESAEKAEPAMRVLKTAEGIRFGLFGERPPAPAPTLFVFALDVDDMAKHAVYSQTGRGLADHGWLYVALDPPCHGEDQRKGEPAALAGWAHRVKNGQDLMAPFTKRCVQVLDHLVRERYADPKRVAVCGTSRGGFCALHFAAAEPRVLAVTCVSPVTNLLALSEFSGVTEMQVRPFNAAQLVDKLAGRAVWLSIGNDDSRVGTDDCIALARQLVATARRRQPDRRVVPVELVVGPADGHHGLADAYALATRFVLQQVPKAASSAARD